MESLETSAKTVAEAIQLALNQLGVSREEVEVIVVKEGRSGILGLGAEDAVVRVKPLAKKPAENNNIVEAAKGILETLLAKMGVACSIEPRPRLFVEVEEGAATPIVFDIKGDDLGILIGRRGQTLSCLQFVARLIVGHQTKTWVPVVIDVEEYKQRRYEALRSLAWRMAEQVKTRKSPFTLEPMPAYERRIIHLALAEHPDVSTESTGEGEVRRVVIMPKKR